MAGMKMAGTLNCALAAGLYLMLPAAVPAQAQGVSCGDTITADVVLQQDLDCELSAGRTRGLTVRGQATLDLGGFNVSCEGGPGDSCVVLVGARARLQSGGVHTGRRAGSSNTRAVRVAGAGHHTVQGIEAFTGFGGIGDDISFWVESDGNRLQDNRTVGRIGFLIKGDDNFLLDNTVRFSEEDSFIVRGANNRLQSNTMQGATSSIIVQGPNNFLINNQIDGAAFSSGILLREGADFTTVLGNILTDSGAFLDGIVVSSDHNLITSNSAQDLGEQSGLVHGIALRDGATGNVVLGNRVTGAVTDLVDENRGCDDNVWLANVFETVNQPCAALRLGRR